MTFRPSVVPDRDNDIISTFTRSFESARNLVRQDQADKRARILFEQQTTLRAQDIEDRERAAAIASGQAGTFDPDRFQPDPTGQNIARSFSQARDTRVPLDEGSVFAGQAGAPGAPARGPAGGPPSLLSGPGGTPNIFAQAGQETRATAGAQPSLIAGVGGAPEVVTPPEFGVGGVGVISEPPSREERLRPGFLPEAELPEDAVQLPGGRMFSRSLARLQGREEGAADIAAVAEATEGTEAGRRAAARETRDVAEFEDRSPSEIQADVARANANLVRFGDEIPPEIPRDDEQQINEFADMLIRQQELIQRNQGLGSVSGRQREARIQRIVDEQMRAEGFEEVPPGLEGQRLLARWRGNAERQVDAESAGEPGEDVTTAELVEQADLARLTPQERDSLQANADSFVSNIEITTRNLPDIQQELDLASRSRQRLLEPLILQLVTDRWNDPDEPWSDPTRRPGAGLALGGRGRGAGPDAFKEANSPQEIVDIFFGRP